MPPFLPFDPRPTPRPLPAPLEPVGVIGTADTDYFNAEVAGRFRTSDLADIIWAQAGHDIIFGAGGHDILDGGSGNDRIEGGEGDDTLWGDLGQDALDGGNGNDVLHGGDGWDTLSDLGSGTDELRGGPGPDTYFIASVGDMAIEAVYEDPDDPYLSPDTVRSLISYTLSPGLENLSLLGAGTNGVGNAGDNEMDARAGGITLRGGAGDDRYRLRSDTVVMEASRQGHDVVHTAAGDYRLPANVEDLIHSGDGTARGNELPNYIHGRGGTLVGAGGGDRLYGGDGATYLYESTSDSNLFGMDRIDASWDDIAFLIDVSAIDADATTRGANEAFRWGGTTLKGKGYLWVELGSNVSLFGNTDGDADPEFAVVIEVPYLLGSEWPEHIIF